MALTQRHYNALADAMVRARPVQVGESTDRLLQWHRDMEAVIEACEGIEPHFKRAYFWARVDAGLEGTNEGSGTNVVKPVVADEWLPGYLPNKHE